MLNRRHARCMTSGMEGGSRHPARRRGGLEQYFLHTRRTSVRATDKQSILVGRDSIYKRPMTPVLGGNGDIYDHAEIRMDRRTAVGVHIYICNSNG